MAIFVEVEKGQIGNVERIEKAMTDLPPNAIRLRIESFAVTANNVTYAAIGDMFGYWNFFPATREGWGIVPMWGHASVEASTHPDIAVGERVYGYLPMGSHLDILPGDISRSGFRDISAHRQPMSPFYNQYSRLGADPEHDPAREDARMIFGPLFKTGFLIETMFRREHWFGADAVIMTSASSKTALALAHCARQGSPQVKRIGMTSARNMEFVRGTGLYDAVLAYSDALSLPRSASVVVDFAGNASVLRAIHEATVGQLAYSCLVGATHIAARGGSGEPLPGPAPILFFAPDHATATVKELGPKAFGEAVGTSWQSFVAQTDTFVHVAHLPGVDAASDAFIKTVKGEADPATGLVVRM